jgi:hypothetical protein
MIGVSIFGAMLMSEMGRSLSRQFPGIPINLGQMQKVAATSNGAMELPPALKQAFATSISDAMSYIFMGSMVIVAIAIVAILFIPQITLRGRGPQTPVEKAEKIVEEVAPAGPVTPDVAVASKAD